MRKCKIITEFIVKNICMFGLCEEGSCILRVLAKAIMVRGLKESLLIYLYSSEDNK